MTVVYPPFSPPYPAPSAAVRSGPGPRETLADLLAAGRPAAPALVTPDGPLLTYADLRGQAGRLAERLAGLGLGHGDRVAIVAPHPAEAAVAFLGVSLVATAAPLNPGLTEDELRAAMGDADVRALVVPPEGATAARRARPSAAHVVEAGFGVDGRYRVAAGPRSTPGDARPDDAALVLHSSGTTGRPKRVALRHRHLAASIRHIVATYALGPDDVSLAVMPLFHVHGLVATLLATLATGGAVVLPRAFSPGSFRRLVRAHRVTWCTAVPTIHHLVLARDREEGRVRLDEPLGDSVRFLRSASAKLPPPALRALEQRFGVPVLEAYGMTEAAHQMASNPLPPGLRAPGSVGRATGIEIAILGEAGDLVPAGVTGEVVVRGPSVIERYDGMPDADAASFRDGWFRTGDLGVVDRSGYLSLVGRIREMINRAGEKISPLEVEDVLSAHPAVAEAACFALPDADLGEDVAAAVVLRAAATRAELLRHCREHLAAFKTPKRLYVVDRIPRSAVGKVQRSQLPALLGLVP